MQNCKHVKNLGHVKNDYDIKKIVKLRIRLQTQKKTEFI